MNQALRTHIENLRTALLKLPATGARGFEGLIASTLSEVCGVPFRLAGSGTQFGVDARTTYADDAVCFEGKRYGTRLSKNEVLSKISEAAISDGGDTDLWILGASAPITTQLAGNIAALGERLGIGTLVLDWPVNELPPLAVALAMSETAAAEFLEHHVKSVAARANAIKALGIVRKSKSFEAHATRIRAVLDEPGIGIGLARMANSAWLSTVFTSKQKARLYLGQPLAPGDEVQGHRATLRTALAQELVSQLTGKLDANIVAVLGEEGNGKSWLVAQSWLNLPEKPLTVVFTADDFSADSSPTDLEGLLVGRLITQTDHSSSQLRMRRWERKFKRWRDGHKPCTPRLIVFIDGLNQRPQVDWGRWLDAMNSMLEEIGGRLVVSARTAYYESRIRKRLFSPVASVTVPEWTTSERDAILATHGIEGTDLSISVAASLRNPRLLGIALSLLRAAEIEQLKELTVSRLLFEHMRALERDAPSMRPARDFARTLQNHAEEIFRRLAAAEHHDLTVFDQEQLKAVSDGRFFVELDGDSTRYRIEKDGLTLALGFAVVDRLRAAVRNSQDLAYTLDVVIEPIGALDDTADVLIAAITIACNDADCSTEIIAAMLCAFADVQNPNMEAFAALSGLARRRAEAFMEAARRVCLVGKAGRNFDWILNALHHASGSSHAWTIMSRDIQKWLSYYTLSSHYALSSLQASEGAATVEEERTKRQARIDESHEALSVVERSLLSTQIRQDDGDLNKLSKFAFELLAGRPLAPFAESFARWCFAGALNQNAWAPHNELIHLIRLNRVDWTATRRAILDTCQLFEAPNVSRVGKWALTNLLRATGDSDDAARAAVIVKQLTAHRNLPAGWRLVEQYCTTDPCDPDSAKPANISDTARRYAELDVSKLRLSLGSAKEDHDFDTMRPGMARFELRVAILKHRDFIADVLRRQGFPLRQGLFDLHKHNALLTRRNARALISAARRRDVGADSTLRDQDRWIVSQYQQLLAFPLLDANEQIETLLSGDPEEGMLLALAEIAKPLDVDIFASQLERACHNKDQNAQFRLLAHHVFCGVPISAKARGYLTELLESDSERVRRQTLALVARSGDRRLIEIVGTSAWSASTCQENDELEASFGSLVVIEAARHGFIAAENALNRIATSLYSRAASLLGPSIAKAVARRIDSSIKCAAEVTGELAVADFELPAVDSGNWEPARYRASENDTPSGDPLAAFKRLAESADNYEERQKRLSESFKSFKAELTKMKAGLILDRLSLADFDAIAAADEALAQQWYKLFMTLPKERLTGVHNFCLLLAHSLSACDAAKAASLFELVKRSRPLVRHIFGYASVTLGQWLCGQQWMELRSAICASNGSTLLATITSSQSRSWLPC